MLRNDPRPNILLITTDQQRPDTLALYGNQYVRTPHIDALAAQGAVFRNAVVQNPVCIPSRACLQTGRYPHQHGVQYMEGVIDDTPGLPPYELTIMERLQHAGYRTAAFGKIHMMPRERGFDEMRVTGGKGQRWTKSAGLPIGLGPLGRDYAAWLEQKAPGAYERIYEQRRRPEYRRDKAVISNVLSLEEYIEWWIMENTVEFVRRDHDRPFFVWCGFCGPHGPVDPPAPYDGLYPISEVPLPPNYHVTPDGEYRPTTEEQDRIARKFVAYYWGLVSLIDDMIGRILAALEDSRKLENTLILFVSDHGEMGFDFGRLGKGCFYDPVVRVPLIVRPPGGLAQGRMVDGLVETFDIAPTVLDYAGAGIPDNMSAVSLRPLIEGAGDPRECALCEFVANDRSRAGVCLRTSTMHYEQWTDGTVRFYDLKDDPLQRTNLAFDAGRRGDVAEMRSLLIDRLACTGHGLVLTNARQPVAGS